LRKDEHKVGSLFSNYEGGKKSRKSRENSENESYIYSKLLEKTYNSNLMNHFCQKKNKIKIKYISMVHDIIYKKFILLSNTIFPRNLHESEILYTLFPHEPHTFMFLHRDDNFQYQNETFLKYVTFSDYLMNMNHLGDARKGGASADGHALGGVGISGVGISGVGISGVGISGGVAASGDLYEGGLLSQDACSALQNGNINMNVHVGNSRGIDKDFYVDQKKNTTRCDAARCGKAKQNKTKQNKSQTNRGQTNRSATKRSAQQNKSNDATTQKKKYTLGSVSQFFHLTLAKENAPVRLRRCLSPPQRRSENLPQRTSPSNRAFGASVYMRNGCQGDAKRMAGDCRVAAKWMADDCWNISPPRVPPILA
ncbi:hypothetical protein PVT01_070039100, partial [Plasmodium vivax]